MPTTNQLLQPLLESAQKLISKKGDGRISMADAVILHQQFVANLPKNDTPSDEATLQTMHHIVDNFKWTAAAKRWFEDNLPHSSLSRPDDIMELKAALGITADNKLPHKNVVIHNNTFAGIDGYQRIPLLFSSFLNGTSFVIKDAEIVEYPDRFLVKGIGGFKLTHSNLPVVAVIEILDEQIRLSLIFDLPEGWKFSDTFPNLPTTFRFNDITRDPSSPLDDLSIATAQFILSTHTVPLAYNSHLYGLTEGLNFFSEIQTVGMLRLLQANNLDQPSNLWLGGSINPDGSLPSYHEGDFLYPWETETPKPLGINLKAPLTNLNFGFGSEEHRLGFSVENFRMYTLNNLQEWNSNPNYLPKVAYSGKFQIPVNTQANNKTFPEIPCVLEIPIGCDEATLSADFSKFSLTNLGDLTHIVGVDMETLLPDVFINKVKKKDEFKEVGGILGKLQLENIKITVSGTHLNRIRVTIGMPHLNWNVWEDHFKIDSISCTFDIVNPGNKGMAFNVYINAIIEIENISFDISAQIVGGVLLSANLSEGANIPLGALMTKYAGDIPIVDKLSIDSLNIMIEPGKEYSMFMMMNRGANSLKIPVGHTSLELSDIRFSFRCIKSHEETTENQTNDQGEPVAPIANNKTSFTGAFSAKMVFAGLDCTVSLTRLVGGWDFSAKAAEDNSIHVSSLLKHVLDTFGIHMQNVTGSLPDVEVKNLSIEYNTLSTEFDLGGEIDVALPFQFGNKAIDFDTKLSIKVRKNTEGKHITSGKLKSKLEIGICEFDIDLSLGDKEEHIEARFESEKGVNLEDLLKDLIDKLSITGLSMVGKLPDFEILISEVIFRYDITNEQLTFSAKSNYETVFFILKKSKSNDTWGFTVGIEITLDQFNNNPNSNFHDFLPCIEKLNLKNFFLIGSTIEDNDFVLPHLPNLKNSSSANTIHEVNGTRKPSVLNAPLKLEDGITIGAVLEKEAPKTKESPTSSDTVNSDEENKSPMSHMFDMLDMESISIQLIASLKEEEIEIYGRANEAKIPFPGGAKLTLASVSVDLKFSVLTGIEFGLAGKIHMVLDHTPLDLIGRLEITMDSFSMALEIDGELPGPLPGILLEKIGFELGIELEPAPGAIIGLLGETKIRREPNLPNYSFAFVLEMVGEAPNPLYLAFTAPELSLNTAFEAFTNEAPPKNIMALSEYIKGKAISFHWSEGITPLPDGTVTSPGLEFKGLIEIMGGFAAYAKFQCGFTGITADATMNPIHYGSYLSIKGDGKKLELDSVKDANGKYIPYEKNELKNKNSTEVEIVKHPYIQPGGPMIHISSHSTPFIHFSMDISLFDVAAAQIMGTVDMKKLSFQFLYTVSDDLHILFDCKLNTSSGFDCLAKFSLNFNDTIGPFIPGIAETEFELDIEIETDLDIHIDTDQFKLTFNSSFEFEEGTRSIPEFTIEKDFSSFKQVTSLIFNKLKAEATIIFADIFKGLKELGGPLVEETEEIVSGAIKDSKIIAANSEAAYNLIATAAEEKVKSIKEEEEKLEQAVETAKNEVTAIEEQAVTELSNAERELKDGLKKIPDPELLISDAKREVENIVNNANAKLLDVQKEIDKIGNQTKKRVTAIEQGATKEAEEILSSAEKENKKIIKDASQAANKIKDKAKETIKEANDLENAAQNKLSGLANNLKEKTNSTYHSVMHTIGF